MKFVDEYRDPVAARRLVARITDLAGDDHFKFMEVCGGHTHTIYRHGIEHVLPEQVELVHGPGCPVCVIPMGRVDDAIAVAETPGVIFTSFGDMMRVPGSNGNLLEAKARGADVRFVYSPLDALRIAVETSRPRGRVLRRRVRDDRAVDGGHAAARPRATASPTSACSATTSRSSRRSRPSSSRPTSASTASSGPGHVSTVVGNRPYRFVPEQYGKPLVTAGFEPLDILQAIAMLLDPDPRRSVRGREPVHPRRARRGQPSRAADARRGVRAAAALRVARPRVHLAERAASCEPSSPPSTPSCGTRCPACGWPIRRRASAARC